MTSSECFKKIIAKLSRMDLTEFRKELLYENEGGALDVDLWCDAILVWIGKFHKPENERRFLALEKTVQAKGVDWWEYFKSCEALIDAYNKKQSLRMFANKILSQQETIPKKVADQHAVKPKHIGPPSELVTACATFVSVFSELPNLIDVKYTIERHDASNSL